MALVLDRSRDLSIRRFGLGPPDMRLKIHPVGICGPDAEGRKRDIQPIRIPGAAT